MRKLYGWDYFVELAENQPQVGRSIAALGAVVARLPAWLARWRRGEGVARLVWLAIAGVLVSMPTCARRCASRSAACTTS
jgi:hypothetical protein